MAEPARTPRRRSTRGSDVSPALGPPSAPPTTVRGVSAARAVVLEALRSEEPATLVTLADSTDLHLSTLREHLAGLIEAGLVTRERAEPIGRGRPAWRYTTTDPDAAGPPRWAGMTSALAEALAPLGRDARAAAAAAGQRWGRRLAESLPADTTATEGLVAVLDEVGFAPTPEGADGWRLTQCPFIDAAREHPDIVCAVHRGLVRGVLDEVGESGRSFVLVPFAEPGACTLALGDAVQP